MKITALHIHGTGPFRRKAAQGTKFIIEDFELLCTILSALMWRKYNGPIKLYTDKLALEYYNKHNLLGLWDDGVDSDTLEQIPSDINQEIFWACAKIFALRNEKTPVLMLDTDLIVWKSIVRLLETKEFAVLHREYLNDAYLPLELLKKRKDYVPDPDWDWTVMPCNTAFAYFNNAEFLKYYTDCAIDFMRCNSEMPKEMVSQMVFAEQRIVAMCAHKMNIPIFHFLSDPFECENDCFTHLWGAKSIARNNSEQREVLCTSLLKKIHQEFPNFEFPSAALKEMFEKYEKA